MTKRHDILTEADNLIHGERQTHYGTPQDNFSRIAAIWSVILGHTIQPDQVALCMAGLKLARLANGPHHDSYVDAAGYIAIAGELSNANA